MKWLLVFVLVAVVIITFYDFNKQPDATVPQSSEKKSLLPIGNQRLTLSRNGKIYTYVIRVIPPSRTNDIVLILNMQDVSMKRLATEHNCKSAINGGFYTTNRAPLGLFIHNDIEVQAEHVSPLLNGYWYKTENGTNGITREIPQKEIKEALQSGPLLLENGKQLPLTINNDEQTRRSIIAQTEQGDIIFLIIFFQQSPLEGPLLSDLPQLITKVAQREQLVVTSALNLDGGSASGMLTDNDNISELTSVGSIICSK